jgi:phosphomannomutase
MLTSSHNPAEYLGIKLRMEDGGASPEDFTDEVEAVLADEPPSCFDEALANFAAARSGTPDEPATPIESAPYLRFPDIMTPYLEALEAAVDHKTIANADLRVVVDPLFGAGRGYLATVLRQLGVEVAEVNGETDTTFNGLHPEPILPWVQVGVDKVVELGFDACFVTDGDADRIGAVDDTGAYVTSHRVLALLIGHLVEDRRQTGRVVRTRAGSNLLRRQCDRLGLTLITKPIGFKWIYEEMLKGDVLIGGEESGGIGIPSHVRERDGLLMALMLTELMAQKGKKLSELVDELLVTLGALEYARRDLQLTPEQKDALLATHVQSDAIDSDVYRALFAPLGEELVSIERGDGIKFDLASDAWLLVRPSGTEPLVRVYAEATTIEQVTALLDVGCALAQGA